MSRASFIFVEMSPSAPGTAASSQPVQSAASYLPGGVAGPMQDFDAVDVIAEIKGATGGTLQIYVQSSPDDGASWYDMVAFPSVGAGATIAYYKAPISNTTTTASPVLVGKNLTPALINSSTAGVVNGAFTDRMRLVMVAGSGTSAGAQVVVKLAPQRGEGGRPS